MAKQEIKSKKEERTKKSVTIKPKGNPNRCSECGKFKSRSKK